MRERGNRGQVLMLSVVMLSVVLGLVGAFVNYLGGVRRATNVFSARAAARQAALAGLEKSIWCLNQGSGTDCGGNYGGTYPGETAVAVGTNAYVTTAVTALSASLRQITATGYFPSVTNPTATVTLRAEVGITTTDASFFYAVQSGNGGFEFGNNAYVEGNIYSNGDVIGSPGVYVTGDVWVAGGTSLSPDQESTVNNATYEFGRTSPAIDIGQSFKLSGDNVVNKVSLYIRKVGTPGSKSVYILANDGGVPSKTVIGTGTLNASAVGSSLAWVDVTFPTPPALVGGQLYWLVVDSSADSDDYYVIGSQPNSGYGNGAGFSSANWNATTPVWTDAVRDFNFKVWTGGVSTRIQEVHVYGDAHANTLLDGDIDGDAYYETITNTTVDGTSYSGSPDPGPQDMPLTTAMIDQWKADAAAGGTISGDALYDGDTVTLGPKRITGNLTVDNNSVLTMNGTVYVQGDVTLSNNSIIQLASGYEGGTGVIVADGKVTVSNNVSFEGSGIEGSYVMILTTNPSLDSISPAMLLNNNSDNSIFYASNGMISVANNAILKEVTAFKLKLENNAAVVYESGLANVNFTSGPGGSWTLRSGTVRELR